MVLNLLKRILGHEENISFVPPMDGALKPNSKLEEARLITNIEAPNDITIADHNLYFSSKNTLLKIDPTRPNAVAKIEKKFTDKIVFATNYNEKNIAVGIQNKGLYIKSIDKDWVHIKIPDIYNLSMTAACFRDEHTIAICIGSTEHKNYEWKRDLMTGGNSGCIILLDLQSSEIKCVYENLSYPNGIISLDKDTFAVSESWQHRVIKISLSRDKQKNALLDNLPAYPSRIAKVHDNHFLMSLFIPRRQLFEMVLNEKDFRNNMITTLDPEDWIGPELKPSNNAYQPIQQGSVRQMGIIKPWAPSRSYGLVVLLDEQFNIIKSWHSRANGTRHGITDIAQFQNKYYAISYGGNCLLEI